MNKTQNKFVGVSTATLLVDFSENLQEEKDLFACVFYLKIINFAKNKTCHRGKS